MASEIIVEFPSPLTDKEKKMIYGYKGEVVRCKDCKHRDPEDHKCDCGELERAGCVFPVGDDYFCSFGERRDDERK